LNNRLIVSLLFSSLLGGVTFWGVLFGEYILKTILNGQIPFDAFVILMPILMFACVIGGGLCAPIYYFLRKRSLDKFWCVSIVSVAISIIFSVLISRQYTDIYIYMAAIAAGLVSSTFLCVREKIIT
jgi:hypothetical protein